MLRIKIHEAYRKIVALSDPDLLGKKFIEGRLQLDIKESFYGGTETSEEEAIEILKCAMADDATFNIVGKDSIAAALKAGVIGEEGIITIKGIPHALGLI